MKEKERIRVTQKPMDTTFTVTLKEGHGTKFDIRFLDNIILVSGLPLKHGKYLHAKKTNESGNTDSYRFIVWESYSNNPKETITNDDCYVWKNPLNIIDLLREIRKMF